MRVGAIVDSGNLAGKGLTMLNLFERTPYMLTCQDGAAGMLSGRRVSILKKSLLLSMAQKMFSEMTDSL